MNVSASHKASGWADRVKIRTIRLGTSGRVLRATPVFDTYWRFAAARQEIFHKRVRGEHPPWTEDPILARHRFTNCYRASDRVSQYLIQRVIYDGDGATEEVFFRTLLFKIFNKLETWETLKQRLGEVSWRSYRRDDYEAILDALMDGGERVYSAAYIMPSPNLGARRKHANHLRLIERMMADRVAERILGASLSSVYETLLKYPSIGSFLAFQLAIDLNYSPLMESSEMEFVVAGPGAKNGIRKCFTDTAGLSDADLIRAVSELAESEFQRLGLQFRDLWGRPLQLIDCQNLFCEVDKYSRVAHPEFTGASGRTKIKQRFDPRPTPIPQWYPPKWGIAPTATTATPGDASGRLAPKQASLFDAMGASEAIHSP